VAALMAAIIDLIMTNAVIRVNCQVCHLLSSVSWHLRTE